MQRVEQQLDQHPPAATTDAAVVTGSRAEARFTRTLGWDEVTRTDDGFEQVVHGPSAVVTSAAGALVLDRLAGRVLDVTADGARVLCQVPVDSEDLSANDDVVAAFSPVRSTAWLFAHNGAPRGELLVPRALRELTGLAIAPSHRLIATTAYQERLELGSPSAPMSLQSVLASKREGAVPLPDHHSADVVVEDGRAILRVLTHNQRTADPAEAGAGRATVERSLPLGSASAARIVGADAHTVCLRIERVTSTPDIAVDRRVSCVATDTGELTFERDLPAPGLYLPRRELSFARGHLAFIHPTQAGLQVSRWEVKR